jgi:two-component system sensor histidine kinase KdpD
VGTEPQRPDPEQLLKRVQAEEQRARRGKLRLFLGFAAGVGKTYAMLEAAGEQRAQGRDVVVGYVETHGRKETEALLEGLPIIPRRTVTYRDVTLEEIDLDAVLARRPELAVVDELAHTNAPGSRHSRRFHDVEELLAAGIDVYSTLNIQHVESLNDVVAQITGIVVRETVPDRILEKADQVELVDISPDELIERLREGKVYVPEQAVRAIRKFFRPGNLTALRELSLRYLAGRVDQQMRRYMEAHAIAGPWAAGERVLVAVGPGPVGERLVRAGRRLASSLGAEWIALFVETPEYSRLPQDERDRVSRALRMAEELGAHAEVLTGSSPPEEIVRYAQAHNVTKIVAGVSLRPRWVRFRQGSLVDWILRHSENIDVYVISGPSEGRHLPVPSARARRSPLQAYLYAFGLVALVTLTGQFIHGALEPTNLTMMYLLTVVIVAVQWGRGPSILAATLAVLAFDFFFVPPRFTVAVADTEYLITFAGLLVVGLVISALAGRVRDQVHAARQREAATAALYALSRDLAAASATEEILASIAQHVGTVFNRRVAIFIASDGRPDVAYQRPEFPLTDNEQAVAAWVMQHGEQAGRGTETLPAAQARYVPLKTAQGVKGVLGVVPAGEEPALTPEQQQLLQAFASQAALALERVQAATASQRRELSRETEKLQAAVLNSLSHDLRTPLASVSGALSSLLDGEVRYDDGTRRALLETAKEGADRLTHLVRNLLDMTRVEAGALTLRKEPGDIEDLVGAALAQLGARGHEREVEFDIPPDLPSVPMDFALMTQALSNVLDNALKYAPAGSPVRIEARVAGGEVHVSVADRGPGIPESELTRIFDKFHRAERPADGAGLGLGLAISRGIVEAHDGRIWAANHREGGAVITFALPYVLGEPGEIRERLDEPAGTASADR